MSVRGLPGCWSQRTTEAEALANIRHAIHEYPATRDDLLRAPSSEKSKSRDRDPANALTMGGIARDAGLTVEQFKALL